MEQAWPPTLAIAGRSNAGKTTLLEGLIPRLAAKGLKIAVIKHGAHELHLDREGKDTDRLFKAAADVLAHDREQTFIRRHLTPDISRARAELGPQYDLILLEGHKESRLPKLWLADSSDVRPPDGFSNILAALPPGDRRQDQVEDLICKWLDDFHRNLPLIAGVLIGGTSSRMGRPKTVLHWRGKTMLEHVVSTARAVAEEVVLLGSGELSPRLADMKRLPDIPGVEGPLVGIISAFRWGPRHRWLILPADLPALSAEALELLLKETGPGRWAVLPRVAGREASEPLGSIYDPPMGPVFEKAAAEGKRSLWKIVAGQKIHLVEVEGKLARAWADVDTPEDWEQLKEVY